VCAFDGSPVSMIRVTAYRDTSPASELTHEFTDANGNYRIAAPSGSPITLRFDTHYSLTNAREWHPSVVANTDASQDVLVNRFLLKVGTDVSYMAAIDALAAYQFCSVWNAANPNRQYSEHAAARLQMIKFTSAELQDTCRRLVDHFSEQAQS
jgi:hypothetical protein